MSEKNSKPCPFCGGGARGWTRENAVKRGEYFFWEECNECGIRQPFYYSLDDAIAAWNRRVKCASTLIGT